MSEESGDVRVEEVSDSLLRVTIGGKSFDVFVRRTFRTHEHFGEFDSLDDAIRALKVHHEAELDREQAEKQTLAEKNPPQ